MVFSDSPSKKKQSVFSAIRNGRAVYNSPYSAHLNFKLFQNFFDVEVCGENDHLQLRKIRASKYGRPIQQLMFKGGEGPEYHQNTSECAEDYMNIHGPSDMILAAGAPRHPGQGFNLDDFVKQRSVRAT